MLVLIHFRGLGDKRTEAFRDKYSRLGDFRAVCPSAAFIALTATATRAVEEKICKLLQMSPYKTLRRSPEKKNIR